MCVVGRGEWGEERGEGGGGVGECVRGGGEGGAVARTREEDEEDWKMFNIISSSRSLPCSSSLEESIEKTRK